MTSNTDSNAVTSRVRGLTGVANFFAWRPAMEPILTGYRALEIVQGYEPCPSMPLAPTSIDLKLVEAWKDRNAKAMSQSTVIQQTISAPMAAMIRSAKTSAEMWTKLHDLNSLSTPEHRNTINRKISNLFLKESGDMTKHLETFIEIVDEAEAAGLPWGKDDEEKAHFFLNTFPHTLRPVKREWR
ncbi:hypothetical protein A4X09_0g2638, partial [Tilletia walkeri]